MDCACISSVPLICVQFVSSLMSIKKLMQVAS